MINVLICDDSHELREYIATAISVDEELKIVGQASSGVEAVKLANEFNPDVILMDIQMDYETDGIEATEQILETHPKIKIIMLTIHTNDELIMNAYYAGASDYIIKTSNIDEIIYRIKTVYNTDKFIGPLIAQKLSTEFIKLKTKQDSLLFFINGFSTLTRTEREILKMLYKGCSRTEISKSRMTELSTTISHVKHIKRKLNFTSTKELLSFLRKIKLFEMLDI